MNTAQFPSPPLSSPSAHSDQFSIDSWGLNIALRFRRRHQKNGYLFLYLFICILFLFSQRLFLKKNKTKKIYLQAHKTLDFVKTFEIKTEENNCDAPKNMSAWKCISMYSIYIYFFFAHVTIYCIGCINMFFFTLGVNTFYSTITRTTPCTFPN